MSNKKIVTKLSDKEETIVEQITNQEDAQKFLSLYRDGDTSAYKSKKSAQIALCAKSAFRVGQQDTETIDHIFRSSALMDDSWNNAAYRETVIRAGIKACKGVFHRDVIEKPDFITRSPNGRDTVSPMKLAEHVQKLYKCQITRDNNGFGDLICIYNGGHYEYCPDDENMVHVSVIDETFKLLFMSKDAVCIDEFDRDENIINFKNGLLHVSASELKLEPHSPEVLSSIQIDGDWVDEPEPTPVFDAFMDTLTDHDKGVQRLLLQFIGLILSNIAGWVFKIALFLVGPSNSGKSVLRRLVESLLGKDNCVNLELSQMNEQFGVANLYGKRLGGSSDMSHLSVSDANLFKQVTGGDRLLANIKYRQQFSFTYNGVLWFCMNELPRFSGGDKNSVYNRMLIVECPNAIPAEDQDKHLDEKLHAERNGITQKAVKGLQELIQNGGLSVPESVKKAKVCISTDSGVGPDITILLL